MSNIETAGRVGHTERTTRFSQRAERRFAGVVKEFAKLAEKPMAGDPKMGAFYSAVGDLTQNHEEFRDIVHEASRRKTTPDHLANLLLRGVQYIEIFSNERREFDATFTDPEAWKELLVGENGVVTQHGDELKDILAKKETTTTKYPRYAGVKAALNAVFPDQDIKVADFGCGANYGLRGLRGDIPFPPVTVDLQGDESSEAKSRANSIATMIDKPVYLAEGLAVDKTDPAGEEETKWRLACSFYPSELSTENLEDLVTLEEEMIGIDKQGMSFLQGDLLKLQHNHADGTLPESHFDAVVMSTILYQMSREQQMHMIETAKKSLNEGGVIILQDFASKDTNAQNKVGLAIRGLNPEPYSYRTFVMHRDEDEWSEFLQWKNGRCKEVRPGADFDNLVPTNSPTEPISPNPFYDKVA